MLNNTTSIHASHTLTRAVLMLGLLGVLSACGGSGNSTDTTNQETARVELSLSVNNNSITANWSKISDAQSYTLHYTQASINSLNNASFDNYNQLNPVTKTGITDTAYTIENLTYGNTYYVIVQSIRNAQTSDYKNGDEKHIQIPVPQPTDVSMYGVFNSTNNSNTLKLRWNAITGVNSYDVYTSQTELTGKTLDELNALVGNGSATKTATDKSSMLLSNITANTHYYGVVVAKHSGTFSTPSTAVKASLGRFSKLANYEDNCVVDTKNNNQIWEVKTSSGLHNKSHTYSWYNSTLASGHQGNPDNTNNCQNTSRCDTEKFVADVNSEKLCALTGWRLPTGDELSALKDEDKQGLKIDTDYFPNTSNNFYWSNDSHSTTSAYAVNFRTNVSTNTPKYGLSSVRLINGVASPN